MAMAVHDNDDGRAVGDSGTMTMAGLWVTLGPCRWQPVTVTMTMTMAGCPPWRLRRWQMPREPPRRPPAMAYFWSPWQLPISRCPSHTKPWLCRWGQRGDNGGGGRAGPLLHPPRLQGHPGPSTCGSDCAALSCASISSLSICSSRDARIWGAERGLDRAGTPPRTTGNGREGWKCARNGV